MVCDNHSIEVSIMEKEKKKIDLIIIGSGIAGLTAGIYSARLKLLTLILEDELVGGQIRDSWLIENYPGFSSISGPELTEKIKQQAIEAGAVIDEFDIVKKIVLRDDIKIVETDNYIYEPTAVIIAAGSKKRRLPVNEEERYRGRGVHYCEVCDGQLYEGKNIIIVGGGNSAVGAALFLRKYASEITVVHQFDKFQADAKNIELLMNSPQIKVIWDSEIRSIYGDEKLKGIEIENVKNGEKKKIDIDGVFTFIGMVPRTDLYREFINIDRNGNIIADESCETNVKGVYAAGDVRTKRIRQLTTAASDGTVAALMAENYIKNK